MNDAHIHLLVNHFPIIGLIIGTLILLTGIVLRSVTTRKIALTVILFSVIFSIPAFSTGEGAEEILEHGTNLSEEGHHMIHEHEEIAEVFMMISWGLIGLSLISLFLEWKKKKIAVIASIAVLGLAIVGCYFAKQVGTSGGEISHPEIRKDFKAAEHEEHEERE